MPAASDTKASAIEGSERCLEGLTQFDNVLFSPGLCVCDYQFSPKGRSSTLNDHALRSW
jgi:hypothetical protein